MGLIEFWKFVRVCMIVIEINMVNVEIVYFVSIYTFLIIYSFYEFIIYSEIGI